jgi:hypothetical protein
MLARASLQVISAFDRNPPVGREGNVDAGLENLPRALRYLSWGCTGFDVGSDAQQGMSRISHLVNPSETN